MLTRPRDCRIGSQRSWRAALSSPVLVCSPSWRIKTDEPIRTRGWLGQLLQVLNPAWYADSDAPLAVVGSGEDFRRRMVDCYRNLAAHMPDNGFQVVTFTHQDAAVWADLALVLWAAGLRVTAACCVATETESALKEGTTCREPS